MEREYYTFFCDKWMGSTPQEFETIEKEFKRFIHGQGNYEFDVPEEIRAEAEGYWASYLLQKERLDELGKRRDYNYDRVASQVVEEYNRKLTNLGIEEFVDSAWELSISLIN